MTRGSFDNPRQLSLAEKAAGLLLRSLPIRHGKHRLLDHLQQWIRFKDSGWANVRLAGGLILIDTTDLVGRHLAVLRNFDPEVCDVLEAAVPQADSPVLWDIGANQGSCCYALASRVRHLRVVAIEPQARLQEQLERNLAIVASGRSEVIGVAVGQSRAESSLVVPKANMGRATLIDGDERDGVCRELVSIMPPDQILAMSTFGPPDIIKIDVEGYERTVIVALEKLLRDWGTAAIVFESHDEDSPDFRDVVSRLEVCGYDVFRICKTLWETRLKRLSDRSDSASDFIAMRRGIPRSERLQRMAVEH